jgi:hypothetical protein
MLAQLPGQFQPESVLFDHLLSVVVGVPVVVGAIGCGLEVVVGVQLSILPQQL